MMNISENSKEASCKGRENGDVPTGSERPHKKARFAWQVKGKYHLKNEISEVTKATTSKTTSMETANPSTTSGNNIGTEQNLEILGDYLLKQDFNTLDSVIADSEESLLKPSTSISNENLPYPRYVSSSDNNVNSNLNKSSVSSNELQSLPVSMVVTHNRNYVEDQCIARWQARQMAKGYVDNTINRVLDSWIHVPLPAEGNNTRFLALDVAEFINNMPGDNSIENEGILMAISAHGLQNNSSTGSNTSENSEGASSACSVPSPSGTSSPLPFEDDNEMKPSEPVHDTRQYNAETMVNSENDFGLPWSLSDDEKIESTCTFSESPDQSYQYFSENQNFDTQDVAENIPDNHCDFLDAAIMFAIQNKGLTAFGTSVDYG